VSKVTYEFSGDLSSFHASPAGGLVVCLSGGDLFAENDHEQVMATVPVGAKATVTVEVELPEAPELQP
jgi:hypothetical protein